MNIGEYTVVTNPAPSYGGTLMIFMLNLLKKSNQLDGDIIEVLVTNEVNSGKKQKKIF